MSTKTELEIVSPGAFASLQDGGRHGFRRIGVPWAGVLDRRLMRIANALAGRDEDAPVIECFDGGLQLRSVSAYAYGNTRYRADLDGTAATAPACSGSARCPSITATAC